jgi:hypothetical protein
MLDKELALGEQEQASAEDAGRSVDCLAVLQYSARLPLPLRACREASGVLIATKLQYSARLPLPLRACREASGVLIATKLQLQLPFSRKWLQRSREWASTAAPSKARQTTLCCPPNEGLINPVAAPDPAHSLQLAPIDLDPLSCSHARTFSAASHPSITGICKHHASSGG